MARTIREQVDEGILDRAAALFARRGYAKTSLQDLADAVGLSKAGLLHHFPSKDALRDAVLALGERVGDAVLAQVADTPAGPDRDRLALEVLLDVAVAHPGLVALLLAPVTEGGPTPDRPTSDRPASEAAGGAALTVFGVDPAAPPTERSIRVVGALAALAVLTLAAHQQDRTTAWRRHILSTCFDALGHPRPTRP